MSNGSRVGARFEPVDLARESDFALGRARVRPSLCEVVADGRTMRLQRRVMQVLVALARADPEVVSKDELVAKCWGGLAVSDDAINRCIGALRRLAEDKAPGCFAIETLTRIGYRLNRFGATTEAAAAVRPSGPPADSPEVPRAFATARPEGVQGLNEARPVLLAVLAFDNLSGDPEMAYFSDGVSEEIRETIARGTGLRVIGRASSFHFRGAEKAAANVGAQLGATHVLDGSVRCDGGRVRISTDLVSCENSTTLWSERFDRELTDIFALQDEIAAAVATAMKTAFERKPQLGRIDPAAHDLYLRARAIGYGAQFGVGPRIAALQQVVAIAPNLAPAWALMAVLQAISLRLHRQGDAYAAGRAQIVEAAETALRLDPGAGAAYVALAYLEPWAAYSERESLLQKAVAAAPNDPDCLSYRLANLFDRGRHREALGYAIRANEVDPFHAIAGYFRAILPLYCGAGPEEYHQRFVAFRNHWPQEEVLGMTEALYQALMGNWALFDESAAEIRRRGIQAPIERRIAYFATLRDPSDETRAQALGRLAKRLEPGETLSTYDLHIAWSTGLKEEVFSLLEQTSFDRLFDRDGPPALGGTRLGEAFLISGKLDMPRDPRFVRFCAKIGLVHHWLSTDQWPDCVENVDYDFRAEARGAAAKGLARSA